MRRSVRIWLIIILALAGVFVSISLTRHYYLIRGGDTGFRSYCNISSKFNCDAVAASSYAEPIPGVPLSALGGGWFLAVFCISLIGAFGTAWRKEIRLTLLGLAVLGSAVSMRYLLLMAFKIHSYCVFCLVVDALNFVILGLVISLKSETSRLSISLKKIIALMFILTVSLLIAILSQKKLVPPAISPAIVELLIKEVMEGTPVVVEAGDQFPSMGSKSAPITIVEFADFECPFCRIGAITLKTIIQRYPEQVRIVLRNYPLDTSCNWLAEETSHENACGAALAGWCANSQGHFEGAYEAFFSNQNSLDPEGILKLVTKVGVNPEAFERCINSSEAKAAIERDIAEASKLKIRATPTYFINGRRIESAAYDVPVWIKIIEKLL